MLHSHITLCCVSKIFRVVWMYPIIYINTCLHIHTCRTQIQKVFLLPCVCVCLRTCRHVGNIDNYLPPTDTVSPGPSRSQPLYEYEI